MEKTSDFCLLNVCFYAWKTIQGHFIRGSLRVVAIFIERKPVHITYRNVESGSFNDIFRHSIKDSDSYTPFTGIEIRYKRSQNPLRYDLCICSSKTNAFYSTLEAGNLWVVLALLRKSDMSSSGNFRFQNVSPLTVPPNNLMIVNV